ncbi:MAG: hypothetical protein KDB61_09995, partial [Planctomycetes bacterium]|nr:hypothetical protein [Planctomycetota bacterium]
MRPESKGRPRILAGIDEAGLGPMLGPLTLGLSAFRVPADGEGIDAADLWDRLKGAVAPEAKRGEERLIVADSKAVFQRTALGWRRLESTALAFLKLAHPTRPANLFEYLTPGLTRPTAPWYAELAATLPTETPTDRIDAHRDRLEEALHSQDIRLVEACISVVPASELNRSFRLTQSKSQTAWIQAAHLLAQVFENYGSEGVHVIVDRQGARKRYAPLLERDFPGHSVATLQESDLRSDYWVEGPLGVMEVSFQVGAENQSMPTALASCFAKYARELSMDAFNRYFEGKQAGLKGTAGYVTDGRR